MEVFLHGVLHFIWQFTVRVAQVIIVNFLATEDRE